MSVAGQTSVKYRLLLLPQLFQRKTFYKISK